MTANYPEEAIEAAKDAILRESRKRSHFGTSADTLAQAAFEAAAPWLRAQALEDAEKVIDAELQDAPAPCYEENDYEAGYIAGLTFAQDDLRARAVTERGEG